MLKSKNRVSDIKAQLLIGLVLFGLIFFRYCYFGFEYYFQLDDYIQYHNFPKTYSDITEMSRMLGIFSSRPLAGIADYYLWSRFFDGMIWAVGIISSMYAASALIFRKVFFRRFGTGYMFLVVYALLPFNFEGAYWVSASSRIITGLFFASLALYFFDRWCREGKKVHLIFYSLCQLICFCFYEQVMVISCALTFMIMVLSFKKHKKRWAWGFLMLPEALLYFLGTSLAPSGVYGSRSGLFLPWQEGWTERIFKPMAVQLEESVSGSIGGICFKGLLRGFDILTEAPNFIWILTILLLCACFFLLIRDGGRRWEFSFLSELVWGILLAAAPLAVFFVLESPWLGIRNLLPCLCGLGLVADALFDLLFCRVKKGFVTQGAILAVLALLCCIASVSELKDYKSIYFADIAVAQRAADALDSLPEGGEEDVWVLNVDASYLEDCNLYYHEHGYGVTSSNWALTGAVRCFAEKWDTGMLTPVSAYAGIFADRDTAESIRLLVYKNGDVLPGTREAMSENSWRIFTAEGEQALLSWENGFVTLSMN